MKSRMCATLTDLVTANVCLCRNIFRMDSLVDISTAQDYYETGVSDLRSAFAQNLGHICF